MQTHEKRNPWHSVYDNQDSVGIMFSWKYPVIVQMRHERCPRKTKFNMIITCAEKTCLCIHAMDQNWYCFTEIFWKLLWVNGKWCRLRLDCWCIGWSEFTHVQIPENCFLKLLFKYKFVDMITDCQWIIKVKMLSTF